MVPLNGSRFEPVIGNPGDGASPSCGIADEFHEHATSDQVDTFVTGMGARDEPMMLYITTAGSNMGGPCYAKRLDCISILKGTESDEKVFAIIYTIDDPNEWDTVEAQKLRILTMALASTPSFCPGNYRRPSVPGQASQLQDQAPKSLGWRKASVA